MSNMLIETNHGNRLTIFHSKKPMNFGATMLSWIISISRPEKYMNIFQSTSTDIYSIIVIGTYTNPTYMT